MPYESNNDQFSLHIKTIQLIYINQLSSFYVREKVVFYRFYATCLLLYYPLRT